MIGGNPNPNPYTYPTDPINNMDLTGLCSWWKCVKKVFWGTDHFFSDRGYIDAVSALATGHRRQAKNYALGEGSNAAASGAARTVRRGYHFSSVLSGLRRIVSHSPIAKVGLSVFDLPVGAAATLVDYVGTWHSSHAGYDSNGRRWGDRYY